MTVWVGRSLIGFCVLLSVALACGADDVRRAERYGDWLAKMAAFEGSVDAQRAGKPRLWDAAVLNDSYFEGDRVRTGERSRAQLQLRQENFLTLDQNSVALLGAPSDKLPSWLQLILGKLRFRSRQPSTLGIQTPFVNAIHRGTEFQVEVRDQETLITVFDGEVEAKNEHGVLSITKGQSAIARKGEAPRLYTVVKPEDAVQWSLYYPPVLDFGSVPAGESSELQRALNQYRRNDINGALVVLDSIPAESRTPRILNLRAGLLLTVGRLDEARPDIDEALRRNPKDATALAQQAVVAVAQNRKDEALRLAEQAVAADPKSSSAKLALSYALQARFQLPEARDAIRSAHRDDPNNALVLARLAELELSLGDMDKGEEAATEALRINPRQGRAKSLLGFAQLMQMDTDEAIATFNQAVTDDPSDPLGRFGLGLAKIRKGDLEAGTVEMETAASLSPDDPLIRSYLGKAYYEQKRSEPAATEYQIAKELDPKDPTPYFYDAIKKQTENRPVEALGDLQTAIRLNDSKIVFRSRQNLDDDLAARTASLGRIFRDIGMDQRAQVEGWKSVIREPTSFSGHRLLADSYKKLTRQESSRVSEVLISQLLQPASLSPIPPSLSETNLLVLDRSGTGKLSFNEFNPIFFRNKFALQTSALVGGLNTFGDEVVHSGIYNRFSYSLGQYHYQTSGYRKNNDLTQNIYNAFLQQQFTPALNTQIELRETDSKFGDIKQKFDLYNSAPNDRTSIRNSSIRGGATWQLTDRFGVIASFLRTKDKIRTFTDFEDGESETSTDFVTSAIGELQSNITHDDWKGIFGGRYVASHRKNSTVEISSGDTSSIETPSRQVKSWTLYSYNIFDINRDASVIAGLSYDYYDQTNYKKSRLNPKFGLLINLTPSLLIRLTALHTLKRPRSSDPSIEPAQIAGFNQFFDDPNGSQTERYAIALDKVFLDRIFFGVEGSFRHLSYPFSSSETTTIGKKKVGEWLAKAYLSVAASDYLGLDLQYNFEDFHRAQASYSIEQPRNLTTTTIPFSTTVFWPNGLFLKNTVSYIHQSFTYPLRRNESIKEDSDQFVLFDASLGFRLQKRHGMLSISVKNIFDERFKYIDLASLNTDIPRTPNYIPERTVFAEILLSF